MSTKPGQSQFRMQDAFGTRSDTVALGRLVELTGLVRESNGRPSSEFNTMLAAVDALRPENDTEGMLAVRMAATHHVAMENLQRSARASTLELMEAHGNLANKLLRTYAAQIEALAKLRRGGSQKVTVEHVHVYEGGQAIVGNVETGARSAPGRGRGQREKEHQPYGPTDPRALAVAIDGEMLRPDPERDAMLTARDEREDAVPDPWRRRGQRSPER
ncbi:hypothetical protein Q8W71_32550 [Methylobacterium sp. NEAU 140]|uniref:hypothetical protein n=1 Tax=Methylobacterium sp. NEAU 140 TaxID=3064945 RepID=UPI0027361B14|nr:hypothetical protein [Methylobacterium sp. NEAU 140]MDP4027294.1 hypothetical protein [Methylobacterium sp. NEAU 140]